MINEEPWLKGSNTKIWQVPFDRADPINQAALGAWLVWAPWMHGCWQYHFASVVHLRPIEGKAANFQFSGATHEFMVVAIKDAPQSLHADKFVPLIPVSIAQQFTRENDAAALELIERALGFVAQGRVSLDSDYQRLWYHLLVEGCRALTG